jgi:hypothetical protein
VTTVPDIPVVRLPALEVEADEGGPAEAPASIWSVDPSGGQRLSPLLLTVLGVVAGVAAMGVSAAAVISAGDGASPETVTAPAATQPPPSAPVIAPVERRALALLAKPSTERVAFRGAPRLVLAVGSGGRAAILIRGLERAPSGKRYTAWIVAPGSAPVAGARFLGTERAVFLARPLGQKASVVVSTSRPLPGPAARSPVAALRG